MERSEALARLQKTVSSGGVIVGAGAGTGLSAKCAEAGGVDLIIIYNSGRYRMAGRGSLAGLLPYGDANAIVVEMANEVLPIVKHTPVLAGVCGTDPFRVMPYFLRQIKDMGFAGVQNFPTVGLFDGSFRQNLEETGTRDGLVDRALRLQSRRGTRPCKSWCGRTGAAYGLDNERQHWRTHRAHPGRVRATSTGDARRGKRG